MTTHVVLPTSSQPWSSQRQATGAIVVATIILIALFVGAGGTSAARTFEFAFVGAWSGAALSVATSSRFRFVVARLTPRERFLNDLRRAAIMVIASSLVPAVASLVLVRNGSSQVTWVAAWSLLVAQATSTSVAACRLPAPPGLQVLCLVAASWWIPALAPPSFLPGLANWTRVPVQWALNESFHATLPGCLAACAPIAGILLAAWLASGQPRRRTVRHP